MSFYLILLSNYIVVCEDSQCKNCSDNYLNCIKCEDGYSTGSRGQCIRKSSTFLLICE